MFSLVFFSTPLASLLHAKVGHRWLLLIGSLLLGFSVASPFICQNYAFLFLFFSITTGIGLSIIFNSGTFILITYFDKRLSVVMGVAASAIGVAVMAWPQIIQPLITCCNWKVAMLIYGGIICASSILAVFMKPFTLEDKTSSVDNSTEDCKSHQMIDLADVIKLDNVEEGSGKFESKSILISTLLNVANNNSCDKSENQSNHVVTSIKTKSLLHMSVPSILAASISSSISKTLKPTIDKQMNIQIESKEMEEKPKHPLITFLKNIKRMFKNSLFTIFIFSNFMFSFAQDIPFIYARDRAIQYGVDISLSTLLITLFGVGNIIGRILFGSLGSIKGVKIYDLYSSVLICGGLSILFGAFSYSYPMMVASIVGYGIFYGAQFSLNAVVLTEITGFELFHYGLSVACITQGLGEIFGVPIAAKMYEKLGDFTGPFIMSGVTFLLSGLVLFAAYCRKSLRSQLRKQ